MSGLCVGVAIVTVHVWTVCRCYHGNCLYPDYVQVLTMVTDYICSCMQVFFFTMVVTYIQTVHV